MSRIRFYDLDVVVIGGKNSAAIAALDLWRHGARVTLVHRGAEMHRHVKYWILPDINNRSKMARSRPTSAAPSPTSQRTSHARHAAGTADASQPLCLRADRLSP